MSFSGNPAPVVRFICQEFKISLHDFYSRRQSIPLRGRVLSIARHTACWLLYKTAKSSYSEIGRIVYRGDHTMGMYAVRRIEKKRQENQEFLSFTNALLMEYKEENSWIWKQRVMS